MTAEQTLDMRGLRCPLPVIRMEALLRRLGPGDRIRILADDPIAAVDIPHFARVGGHSCERLPAPEEVAGNAEKGGAVCVFLVTHGEKP